jgi:predicted cupin superfamily sugar epimerase
MKTAADWIEVLQLQAHPEGGYFRENYRAAESVAKSNLPSRFSGERSFSTAIYFLLRSSDRSVFHRIKSDELWHFYDGGPLSIYLLRDTKLEVRVLGKDVEQGELPQLIIPANCWFGARVNKSNSFCLCGCTVSPGFDFADFEMANRASLLKEYPQHQQIIEELT